MHDTNLLEDQPIAWTPTPDVIERSQLTRFMKQVGVLTWDELYEFSIRDVERFTEEVLKFLDINFDPPYEKLMDVSEGVEFPKWLISQAETRPVGSVPSKDEALPQSRKAAKEESSQAGLNITTMCLDRWQTEEMKDQPAVIWEGEDGALRSSTYAELLRDVQICARGLKECGFGKADPIGIHLPMVYETIVALLSINRIGGIAVPVFSGYGVEAIASRLNAVRAKALFTCDGFSRRGKLFKAFDIALAAIEHCPTIKKVYTVGVSGTWDYLFDHENAHLSDDRLSEYEQLRLFGSDLPNLVEVEPTTAEDPLIILYTSGTTGKPKGIAHTHASFPIKAAQDMAFGTDVGKGTRISWYTDIGWMMGPWLIYGALINGATICIYDGAPDYPTPDRMWEFCAKHKVEVLGISPTLVRSLAAAEGRSGDTLVPMSVASTRTSADDPEFSIGEKSFAGGTGDGDKSVPAPSKKSVPAPNERKGWYRSLKLPHFDGTVTQFITFRLVDSLPQGFLDRLTLELEHDKLTDNSEEYRQRVDEYLDRGAGECILRRPEVAEIVAATILYEHEKSCSLKAWTVMPNHVHILLRMLPGKDLGGFMKRVKGVSARKINLLLARDGAVWQADYFDRYIRDAEHFERIVRYIENNPVVAGLVRSAEEWKFGSAWSGDTLVPMSVASTRTDTGDPTFLIGTDMFGGGTADGDKSVPSPTDAPFERHDLSSLRIFASTGEPWNPAPWWWLFERVGNSKLPIINYSGGTEIAGGILMGNPLLPIKPCSFPAPCPGMDVDILDEDGNSVGPGKVGELVIKQPWIGMARGFWQEKERYLETYWRRFKDIWVHGDWAMRDADGHWFILGRSDDTLKVAGKRVGPAEVESLLVAHPLVTEAAVIGVPDEVKGTAMVAFVVRSGDTLVPMSVASTRTGSEDTEGAIGQDTFAGGTGDGVRSGDTLVPMSVASTRTGSEDTGGAIGQDTFAGGTGDGDKSVPAPVLAPLEAELKALVAKDMGKPLAPSRIHFVSALPKTRNAKVMRRVIRAAYLGEDPGDLSALENPGAVEEIREAGE